MSIADYIRERRIEVMKQRARPCYGTRFEHNDDERIDMQRQALGLQRLILQNQTEHLGYFYQLLLTTQILADHFMSSAKPATKDQAP